MCFGIPLPVGYLISARRDHSAGDARHHADQPLAALDAAGLDRAAHPALLLRSPGPNPAFVRGVDEHSPARTATERPSRSAAVRRGGIGGVLAGARRSASRSTSCASCRATARSHAHGAGGSRCSSPGRAGSCSARSSCSPARSSPYFALRHGVPRRARRRADADVSRRLRLRAVASRTSALALTGAFVIVSQLKINVTNAYAGSIAWSNFFSRLTHSHPGPRGLAGVQRR